jgi:hypothetical protein
MPDLIINTAVELCWTRPHLFMFSSARRGLFSKGKTQLLWSKIVIQIQRNHRKIIYTKPMSFSYDYHLELQYGSEKKQRKRVRNTHTQHSCQQRRTRWVLIYKEETWSQKSQFNFYIGHCFIVLPLVFSTVKWRQLTCMSCAVLLYLIYLTPQ